jgi:hypothetical protein
MAMSKTAPTWTYTKPANTYIWGYKVTIWGQDREGETWSPLPNWNAVLLRTYILGLDDFGSTERGAQGLVCAGTGGEAGACTLTFANIQASSNLVAPNFDIYAISNLKIEVAVVNLDGVESTSKTSGVLAN